MAISYARIEALLESNWAEHCYLVYCANKKTLHVWWDSGRTWFHNHLVQEQNWMNVSIIQYSVLHCYHELERRFGKRMRWKISEAPLSKWKFHLYSSSANYEVPSEQVVHFVLLKNLERFGLQVRKYFWKGIYFRHTMFQASVSTIFVKLSHAMEVKI